MLDIFLNWQFFYKKNISLSLCRQLVKLKLPTCGQGLKLNLLFGDRIRAA